VRRDPAVPARVWLRRRWASLLALIAGLGLVFTGDAWVATCGFAGCPSGAEIRAFRPAEGGRILDRNGRLLGRVTPVRRVNVPLSQVPVHVRQAFVAVEDRRFYAHNGTDWRSVLRATVRNVLAGGVREGSSTITMQVIRNTFAQRFATERSLRRKLIELRVARLMEHHLTKDQILEIYLNVIYLGNGVYGVEAASLDLFGKHARELNLAEGATLAALPKGPSAYTPRNNSRRATARRNLVLGLMADQGYIPRTLAATAVATPMRVAREEWRPVNANDSYALDAVRALVDSVLKTRRLDDREVTVYTTLDATAQRAADRAVARHAARIGRTVQGAMVALDPRTGDIRALVGGRRYERGTFNRALAARRQPGSAFKPFVYSAALAAGMTPATMVDDEPLELEQSDGSVWSPRNFNDQYAGYVTLRTALTRSANAATVRLSRHVGEPRVIAAARRNGITSPLRPVPAIALGALEVTPLELVTAYAPFANGGRRVTPRLVRRVDAADGTPVWSQESVAPVPVMAAADAYQLTSMLRSVVDNGTGRTVREAGVRGLVAGKTGTTNNGADVWFVGYTPTLVAGVWFGYDTPRQIAGDASGGRLAGPAWAEFYTTGWSERTPANAWAPPAGLIQRTIDPETGELAGQWCPRRQVEWFKPGTEPLRECRAHDEPYFADDSVPPDARVNTDPVQDVIESIGKEAKRAWKKIFKF
jgi:penicillin-binding protein 1A